MKVYMCCNFRVTTSRRCWSICMFVLAFLDVERTLLIMIQTPYMDLRIYFAIIPLPLAGHGPEPGIQSRGNCRDLS